MKSLLGPTPGGPKGNERTAANIMVPLIANPSGEITASVAGYNLGPCRFGGKVSAVWMSVGASGKDDSSPLQVSGEVLINGVTCLTTRPSINHISGEASQQKTTKITGDTGITQAVVNPDANSFSAGDVITVDIDLDRTATPTTEISNPSVVVELQPDK